MSAGNYLAFILTIMALFAIALPKVWKPLDKIWIPSVNNGQSGGSCSFNNSGVGPVPECMGCRKKSCGETCETCDFQTIQSCIKNEVDQQCLNMNFELNCSSFNGMITANLSWTCDTPTTGPSSGTTKWPNSSFLAQFVAQVIFLTTLLIMK